MRPPGAGWRAVDFKDFSVCGLPWYVAYLGNAIYNRQMHEVVVYSRKGCHLCDVVKETLLRVQDDADFEWHEVDIDGDPELRQKYNDEVPVVFIDGRKAFKCHVDAQKFLRALARRA
jgi:glutaredoxin